MYEVHYIPHGWDIETVGRFTDQPKAFRFTHLLCLIADQVVFMDFYLEKDGKLIKDTSFIADKKSGRVKIQLWNP